MTVPRKLITDRLHANVDGLLTTISTAATRLFLAEMYDPFKGSANSGDASPFLKSLFPEVKIAAIAERSLNTSLGWGWDKVVRDIAEATHGNAQLGYFVEGQIPATTSAQIDGIVNGYTSGEGHGTPDTDAELAAIIPGVTSPGAREEVREKDDVYYVDGDSVENHVEIKTPKPNYDQMRAAKRRILRIHAVRHPKTVKAFVGMPFNPNGVYGTYGWPTTKYFLDFDRDLQIGPDFWNYVGNSPGTYAELLECFLEVSNARRAELVAHMQEVVAS